MTRKWLQYSIATDYIPAIEKLENTPKGHKQAEALNHRIRQQWSDRGSKTLKQQQGLMDETRRIIKDSLGVDHWSLDFIKFTTAEYTELNNLKQKRVAQRNEATQQLENPDEIVAEAARLLDSRAWENLAAGLAVTTGRRVAEILSTAKFKKKTQWSVEFTGALKRRGEPVELSFEIPTLVRADRVIDALKRLRAELPEAIGMEPREINQKYEPAVARVCDRVFAQLVPAREGKDNLYTHLFRAIYATIATFWFCPSSVNETEFKAAIQGHYAIRDEKNSDLQRSLAASRHYSDYEISDQEVSHYNGKRKGIKLGVGGIQPIQQFKQAMEKSSEPKALKTRKTRSSYRIWQEDKPRLDQILEQFREAGTQQQERFHAFLNWFESQQNTFTQPQTSVEADIPMQSQIVETQPELDQPELDTSETTPDSTISTLQDAKFDQLLDAIAQLVEVQTALLQAQVNPPATPAKVTKPKTTPTDPQTPATTQSTETSEVDQEETSSPRQRSGAVETTAKIHQAIDAIFAYNNEPDRKHTEKWAIGINTLKAFAKSQEAIVAVIGGRNRKGETIQGIRQKEIQQHHQQHQLDPDKHNYIHRGKTKIEEVVKI